MEINKILSILEKAIYTLLVILQTANCLSQETINKNENSKYLVRSTLGSNGLSKVIESENGNYYVSQSVGQTSVTGTFSKNNYTIRQGFQQPLIRIQTINNENEDETKLKANLFPNPFDNYIDVVFDEKIDHEITVIAYNLTGAAVLHKKYAAAPKITISTDYLSKGDYILKIKVENKQLAAKIIKQ